MCNCKPKCNKCVVEYTIRSLPYTISKPGQYCLCKDFVWADATQSAITVLNTENVVLNFNQRKIETTVATTFPVVLVQGSTDVVLHDVHLTATGAGIYLVEGVDVISSNDVNIHSPVLLNLNFALYTEASNGVNVYHLYLKNDLPNVSTSILFYDTVHVKFYDAEITNARTTIRESEEVDIQRMSVKNSGAPGRRCLQIDSLVGKATAINLPPLRISNNIRVAYSIFSGARNAGTVLLLGLPVVNTTTISALSDGQTLPQAVINVASTAGFPTSGAINIETSLGFELVTYTGITATSFTGALGGLGLMSTGGLVNQGLPGALFDYPVRSVLIENSIMKTEASQMGIGLQHSFGCTVRDNQVYGVLDSDGIFISGSGNRVQNNTVRGEVLGALSRGIILETAFSDTLGSLFSKHNTVDNNAVSGFDIGFIDTGIELASQALCTVLKSNVAVGNVQNYVINTGAPQFTFYAVDNIDHCQAPPPLTLAQTNDSQPQTDGDHVLD